MRPLQNQLVNPCDEEHDSDPWPTSNWRVYEDRYEEEEPVQELMRRPAIIFMGPICATNWP